MVHLHYERWICPPVQGWESPTELSTGDGAIEVKLTPSVEARVDSISGLHLVSEISRVAGDGFLRELLLSEPLGVTLRDQITALFLSIVERGANFKTAMPPARARVRNYSESSISGRGRRPSDVDSRWSVAAVR